MPENTPDDPFQPGGPEVGGPAGGHYDEAADSEALRLQVGALTKQIGDYKLLIADFENSRRRLAADAERQRKYSIEPLVKDLLTAFDNLEFAVKAAQASGGATGEGASLVKGVTATLTQMVDILKRHGVHRMAIPPGAAFDPNLHQAVMEQPTNDFAPGGVVSVMQQGFVLHDRVIRPASVVVASAPPAGGDTH